MSSHSDRNSQPRSLDDVLRLAVANTPSTEQDDQSSNLQPMTEERRQFLQETLGAMNGNEPLQRIKSILGNMSKYINGKSPSQLADDSSEEMKLIYEELEEVVEWCEDIDMACDFQKIGGFSIFELLQNSENEGLKWRCGDLIAALCQNNPYCQQKILEETNQLDRLMQLVERTSESVLVSVKAMYALSCLLGGNEVGQQKFLKKDGYSLIIRAMQSDDNSKLRIKSTFLLIKMMKDSDVHKRNLTDMGCVDQLVAMVNQPHSSHHEYIISALLELVSGFPEAVEAARQPKLQLQEFLATRRALLQSKPDSQEELDCVKELEKTIFPDTEEQMER